MYLLNQLYVSKIIKITSVGVGCIVTVLIYDIFFFTKFSFLCSKCSCIFLMLRVFFKLRQFVIKRLCLRVKVFRRAAIRIIAKRRGFQCKVTHQSSSKTKKQFKNIPKNQQTKQNSNMFCTKIKTKDGTNKLPLKSNQSIIQLHNST